MLLNTSATCKPHKFIPGKRKKKQNKRKRRSTRSSRKGTFCGGYDGYIKSDVWGRKRTTILERDNCECVVCGSKAISVHHWFYTKPYGAEKEYQLGSVCLRCHKLIHDDYSESVYDIKKKKGKDKRVEAINDLIESLYGHIGMDNMDREFSQIVM
jgi:5-methylcytosine-specific restriction endonuclease McrA